MSILYPPETEFAKERCRFEAQNSEMGPAGRPFVQRDYPMMMHKAGRPDNGMGPHVIADQVIVESEDQRAMREHEGFRATPLEAFKYLDDQRDEFSKLAAELNHEQQNKLSERASAEVDAARAVHTADVSRHMPAVPVTPIKPRRKTAKES